MELYLAGGINGNCKKNFQNLLKAIERERKGDGGIDLYLAGTQGRRWCMDVYLAGIQGARKGKIYEKRSPQCDVAILESFYYADEWTVKTIPYLKIFMLDSGAFTFFTAGKDMNWNDYIYRYCSFINENKVDLFFELDIDKVVGYDKVKEFRKQIENNTGKQCIPVWHKSRGKEEFIKMCDEYSYVAIGGIVSKEITKDEYKYFPWFINEAHKRNAKIHGLGFTNLDGLTKYHFDSVDSTAWTTGNRFGAIYKFNGKTMVKYNKKPGQRLADPELSAINNFNEWVKFQQYARYNL